MKLKSLLTLLLMNLVVYGYSLNDNDILIKANERLQNLKAIKYYTSYKAIDPVGMTDRNDSSAVFYDFTSIDKILGTKYLFKNKYAAEGFDGTTSFVTINEKKQLIYLSVNNKNQILGVFRNVFSLLSLRNILPQILSEKSSHFNRIQDTLINDFDCFRFEIILKDKSIFMNNELTQTPGVTSHFRLSISKQDLLPRQFISYFEDTPVWTVNYSNYDLSFIPDKSIFDYNIAFGDFNKYTMQEYSNILSEEIKQNNNFLVGTTLTDWVLPKMTGDSVQFSKINAKTVLLEFWFPGCPGCIQIVPEINKLCHEYKPSDVQIFGVEFTKTDSTGLARYINKAGIEYPTLYFGNELAKECGIMAAPAIVLIDANRKVLYSRTGFKKNEIVELVMNKLKFYP